MRSQSPHRTERLRDPGKSKHLVPVPMSVLRLFLGVFLPQHEERGAVKVRGQIPAHLYPFRPRPHWEAGQAVTVLWEVDCRCSRRIGL